MKSAVVLGASSMLGRELIRQLLADGVDILRAGRSISNDIALNLDASALELPRSISPVDVMFHCASAFADDSPSGFRDNLRTNTMGCTQVLELMQRLQCGTCIFAGSISSSIGVEERGRTGYGLSKALGEQILAWGLSERTPGSRFCSIRLPQLFDTEGECCRHQPWFGRIVAYTSRGLNLNMPPESGPRNFLHIQDAARLLIRAAQVDISGIWEACHPDSMSHTEIAQHAYRVFGRGGAILVDANKAPFRHITIPDGAPVFTRLGLQPRITMARGLEMIRDAGTASAFGPMDVH